MAYASVLSAKHQMERLFLQSKIFHHHPITQSLYEVLYSLESLVHVENGQLLEYKLRFDQFHHEIDRVAETIDCLKGSHCKAEIISLTRNLRWIANTYFFGGCPLPRAWAYVSVMSVKHEMERIGLWEFKFCHPDPETRSIYEELCSLESLLRQEYSQMKGNRLRFDPLEEQVEASSKKIEDIIEKAYASSDTKSPGYERTTTNSSFSQQLFKVRQEISSLTEKLKQSKEVYYKMEEEDLQQHGTSTADYVASLIKIDDLGSEWIQRGGNARKELMEWLGRDPSNLDIMAVFGDYNVQETTRVLQQFYEHPYIQHHFNYCVWVTLWEGELAFLSHHKGFHFWRKGEMTNFFLLDLLYRFFNEKRCLIVLDPVQCSEIWGSFKQFLPNDRNGSRIILITEKKFQENLGGLPHEITADTVSFLSTISDISGDQIKLVGLNDEVQKLFDWVAFPLCEI